MSDPRDIVLRGPPLEGLELIVAGLLPGIEGYRPAADGGAARGLSPRLVIPDSGERLSPGDEVTIRDPDGTPLARLRIDDAAAMDGEVVLTGALERLRDPEHGPARAARLRRGFDLAGRTVAVFSPGASPADVLRAVMAAEGSTLVLIAEGTADPAASARLVDELRRVAELVPGAEVRFVPRVELGAGAGAGAVDVTGLVLAGLGAQSVLDFRTPSAGGSGGAVILFTGLSGAGKSTLARALVDRIAGESSHRAVLLDGDDLRRELASELTFSAEDRHRNLERQAWVAARVAEAGGIAVCAPIAPFSASRAAMRAKVEPAAEFVVIHVSTPISVAEQRDRKGLYARARAGLIRDFTGIDSPYEAPEDADLALDTSELSVEACTEAVIGLLNEKGLLKIG